jgi:cytochrome P450
LHDKIVHLYLKTKLATRVENLDTVIMTLETDLQAVFSPAAHANPFPFYEAVRQHGSVLPMPEWNTNFVLSLEVVQKMFRLPSVSSDRMGGMAHLEHTASMTLLRNMMLFHDGANHARLRGLVSSAFTPKAVEETRGFIASTVKTLLEHHAQHGGNFVANVAIPLPLLVILEMLSVLNSERDDLKRWSESVAALFDGGSLNETRFPAIEKDIQDLSAYFQNIAEELRAKPRPGVLSAMANAENGALSSDELLANAALLMVAGHETTTNLLSGAMLEFSRQPEAWQALLEHPEWVSNCVEELLRIISPVTITDRILTAPLEFAGVSMQPGSVSLMLAAANRDPEHFSGPARLIPNRSNAKDHVAFAAGAHYCLGAPLARLEAKIFLEILLEHYPRFTVNQGTATYRENFSLRGLNHLEVELG